MSETESNSRNKLILADTGNSIPGFGFMALFLTIQTLVNSKKNKKTKKE